MSAGRTEEWRKGINREVRTKGRKAPNVETTKYCEETKGLLQWNKI